MLGNALIQAENLGQLFIRIDQAFIEQGGWVSSRTGFFFLACFVHNKPLKLTGVLWTAAIASCQQVRCRHY